MGWSLVTKVAYGRLSDPAGRNASEAWAGLVWGVSRDFAGATHLFSFIGFFVRSQSPFLRPDAPFAHGGARRGRQGWPSRQPFPHAPPTPGHTLTAPSTTARLTRSGTIRGELAIGRGSSRRNLVFGRSVWTWPWCSHAHRRRSSSAADPFSKPVSTPWPASG